MVVEQIETAATITPVVPGKQHRDLIMSRAGGWMQVEFARQFCQHGYATAMACKRKSALRRFVKSLEGCKLRFKVMLCKDDSGAAIAYHRHYILFAYYRPDTEVTE